MVYNAMKLFMEVNPQLFDDCSHDYAESQTMSVEIPERSVHIKSLVLAKCPVDRDCASIGHTLQSRS